MSISTANFERAIRDVHDELNHLFRVSSVLSDGTNTATITDVGGKMSLDVNVTALTLSADDDRVETRSMAMATVLDEASATITYVGEAIPGSSTASAVWRIKKLDSTSGLVITWANGSSDFNTIWDNRASLSYS